MPGTIDNVEVRKRGARIAWSFDASATGVAVEFSGTETFRFADSGLIAAAEVLWQPPVLAAKIWRKLQTGPEERAPVALGHVQPVVGDDQSAVGAPVIVSAACVSIPVVTVLQMDRG